jgi:hypothetical protein
MHTDMYIQLVAHADLHDACSKQKSPTTLTNVDGRSLLPIACNVSPELTRYEIETVQPVSHMLLVACTQVGHIRKTLLRV